MNAPAVLTNCHGSYAKQLINCLLRNKTVVDKIRNKSTSYNESNVKYENSDRRLEGTKHNQSQTGLSVTITLAN